MSLVMYATAHSPARRANSAASARRNGRKAKRSVSIVTGVMAGSVAAVERGRQPPGRLLCGRLLSRLYRYVYAAVAFGGELDAAFGLGEQRVIGAHADV